MSPAAPALVYFNGAFLPKADVRISPDDRGFLLADGVYEVVRAYDGRLFALDDHLRRLARSLRALRIGGVDEARIRQVLLRLRHANGLVDGTCYLQVTRGAAPRRHAFPDPGTPPTVYACTYPLHLDPAKWTHGVHVLLVPDERWARCDIKSTALLPNVLANQRAKEAGVEEAVFVRGEVVTEGSHTNVAAVFEGRLHTHPAGPRILPGVTRCIVLDLARERGIPVVEEAIPAEALPHADEVVLLGTSSEVLPVVGVDSRRVGEGTPGPIAQALLRAFRAHVADTASLATPS